MLPAIAALGLADAVDRLLRGHCLFAGPRLRELTRRRGSFGLPVKLHADQLSNLGGAALAARFGALSADHVEFTDEDGAEDIARAGTSPCCCRGAFYFIRETEKPPVDLFRAHDVPMAIAATAIPAPRR